MTPDRMRELVELYISQKNELHVFGDGVRQWFLGHQDLVAKGSVHSLKYRLKDPDHLLEKLQRKFSNQELEDNEFFEVINDLVGVRVLHLHQAQFVDIHQAINRKIDQNDWVLAEPPKAYTWDPESQEFFAAQGLEVEIRNTHYTSVHYLIKPRADAFQCCEVQVRTLFEEIWGEVDHKFNYPSQTDKVAIREQLRVLSKLVGAGSRLLDSIFRVD